MYVFLATLDLHCCVGFSLVGAVQSLGQEDPLENGIATHSSIIAWRIPQTNHGVAKSCTLLSN